jgi:hypothetical protein
MVQETISVAQATMSRIDALVGARGESTETMTEIGGLLRELAADPAFRYDEAENAIEIGRHMGGSGTAVKRLLARGAGASLLETFALDGWDTLAGATAHWHNYWQVLLMVRGHWEDTIWEPVAHLSEVAPESIRVARHEVLRPGDVQILGPTEPHGWEAGEVRKADDTVLLVWTGDDGGQPFKVIDLATGALTDRWRD